MKNAYKILLVKPEGKSHSEGLDVDGMVILKLAYIKRVLRCRLD
jgi:hypothetical protein